MAATNLVESRLFRIFVTKHDCAKFHTFITFFNVFCPSAPLLLWLAFIEFVTYRILVAMLGVFCAVTAASLSSLDIKNETIHNHTVLTFNDCWTARIC